MLNSIEKPYNVIYGETDHRIPRSLEHDYLNCFTFRAEAKHPSQVFMCARFLITIERSLLQPISTSSSSQKLTQFHGTTTTYPSYYYQLWLNILPHHSRYHHPHLWGAVRQSLALGVCCGSLWGNSSQSLAISLTYLTLSFSRSPRSCLLFLKILVPNHHYLLKCRLLSLLFPTISQSSLITRRFKHTSSKAISRDIPP